MQSVPVTIVFTISIAQLLSYLCSDPQIKQVVVSCLQQIQQIFQKRSCLRDEALVLTRPLNVLLDLEADASQELEAPAVQGHVFGPGDNIRSTPLFVDDDSRGLSGLGNNPGGDEPRWPGAYDDDSGT